MSRAPQIDRRRLLQLAAANACGLWLPQAVWGQVRLQDYPFAIGVASGSPAPDSVVLWTRLVRRGTFPLDDGTGPVTLAWELADDDGFAKIVRRGQVQGIAELGHSVHVEVPGLAPGRWYYYRFMLGDAVSPVGRTRTLPEPGAQVDRLRLAYASCQKWEDGYFAAWRHLLAEQPDAVVFLGDYIYEYPGNAGRLRSPGGGWALDLDAYRRRYAVYKSDPDLQAMHHACPWLMTWDDHEVHNDYAGVHPGYGGAADPSRPEHFVARRNAAYQAYYEHMPLRASTLARAIGSTPAGAAPVPADELRIHARVQFGSLLSLHLLDNRQYRDRQVCTRDGRAGAGTVDPAGCAPWKDPARTLLGRDQERWLDQSLANAQTRETRWNLIAQQTVFGQRDFRPGPAQIFTNDGWDGYPAARRRLTDALRRHTVPNPVFLGGDIHANWVAHVSADPARPGDGNIAVEFCGTSITSRGAGNGRIAQLLAANPHAVFADAQEHGYGVIDIAADAATTRLRVVGDVRQRDTGIATLAAFRVEAGRPVLVRL